MTTLSKHQNRKNWTAAVMNSAELRKLRRQWQRQLEHQLTIAKAVIGRKDEMADFDANMELDEALD